MGPCMLGTFFMVAVIPGGIGYLELIVLFAVILVLFGPKRLPEMARKLGHLTEQLRKAAGLFQQNLLSMDDETLETGLYEDDPGISALDDDELHQCGEDPQHVEEELENLHVEPVEGASAESRKSPDEKLQPDDTKSGKDGSSG